ncbi:MAG: hypothetical protein F4194_09300 [Acidimicrobiia bacterium]|nr:hypothetical protein [Acidimicrobiia bacterium]
MHRHPDSGRRRGPVVAAVAGGVILLVAVLSFTSRDGASGPPVAPPVEEMESVEAAPSTAGTTLPSTTTRTSGGRSEESDEDGGSPSATTSTAPEATTTTTTTLPPRVCDPVLPDSNTSEPPVLVDLEGDDPAAIAVAISRRLHTCADDVVVVHPARLDSAAIAAQLAARFSSPLLYFLPSSQEALVAELGRLSPRRIWLMDGIPNSLRTAGAEIVRMPAEAEELIEWVSSYDSSVVTGASPVTGHTTLHSLVLIGERSGILFAPRIAPADEPSPVSDLVMGGNAWGAENTRLWLVDPGRPAAGLAVAAAVSSLGETALYWHPEATVGWAEAGAVLQEQAKGTSEVWVVGASADSDRWWLEVNLLGPELPGGGSTMFPDRRLVAFYGVTHTGVLGVLGEQGPSEGLERMAPYLEEYAADGLPTIPTFEIIATVATARAGRDGDYSGEISVEDLTPWVEFAAGEGVYVVLDLQPGRTDFLTQAKYYEELLALPHVGLALDPEWRLRSDQVHLRQIGSVDAAEVNAVAEWLADLVRRERLPQKLLMVHQFRFTMIRDRETISVPPELAVVIHMDGQGPLATKYSTWGALTAGAEKQGWHWGWKNFFDEDYPLATPEQVLELDPLVVFVSYQ